MTEEEHIEELAAAAAEAAEAAEEPEGTSYGPQISFLTRGVSPPAPAYISRDDTLRVEVWNANTSQVLHVHLRLLLPDGRVQQCIYTCRPTADRVYNGFAWPLAEGFLIGLQVEAVAPAKPGSVYVRVLLLLGAPVNAAVSQVLVSGYAVYGAALSWPYPRFVGPVEGPGRIRAIVGTDPAPSTAISEVVPAGARWKLISVFCAYTTAAAAGDRHVYLQFNAPGGVFIWIPPVVTQPAGQTYYYSWAIGLDPGVGTLVGTVRMPLPDQLFLVNPQSFMVAAGGMLVGDDFGPARYWVEEWLEP